MKPKHYLLVLAVLGLAFVVYRVLPRHPESPSDITPPSESATAGTNQAVAEAVPMPEPSSQGHPPAARLAGALAPSGELSNAITERMLRLWQAPIDFFGKVVDQDNRPVPGASIHFGWNETPEDEGQKTYTTETDAEGIFSLRSRRGASLIVTVSKDGYYASHGGRLALNYAFANEKPSSDPLNPVVFYLRKKGRGVALLTSQNGIRPDLAVRIPRDNTPVRVDLLQKASGITGQLEIRQMKPPWKEASDWSFGMSIPDGGLVENGDEFQFEAPEDNYQPTVEYHYAKSEINWVTHVSKQFYIEFGQPRKYGWLRIQSDLAQETVFLTYAINPSGSRNLEPAD